jgi:hypothetical protein
MKNRLVKYLKNLISKGSVVEKSQCVLCQDIIDAFNENEFYRINSHIFCSLECFYRVDKIKTEGPNPKAKNSSQTNKVNKSKNKVLKKKPKQKKRKK